MRKIDPYQLWIGNVGDALDVRNLVDNGICAVVDLAVNERAATLPREFIHCRFPLIDGDDNPPWLLRLAIGTVVRLLKAKVPTLVYCGAGMSRSPCVVAGALTLATGVIAEVGLKIAVGDGPQDVSRRFGKPCTDVWRKQTAIDRNCWLSLPQSRIM